METMMKTIDTQPLCVFRPNSAEKGGGRRMRSPRAWIDSYLAGPIGRPRAGTPAVTGSRDRVPVASGGGVGTCGSGVRGRR